MISLFTGIGGLDIGLEKAGFNLSACSEIDRVARAQIARLHPAWNLLTQGDVCAIKGSDFLEASGEKLGDIALLAGGPPCQPFSRAGAWTSAAKGLRDPRAETLRAFFRLIGEIVPKAFLMENVPGLVRKHWRWLQIQIEDVNSRLGTKYVLHKMELQAADYGVPQLRRRVFVVAHRDGLQFIAPKPTHGSTAVPHLTAWDAFGTCASHRATGELALTGRWAELLPTIPEGSNYLFHTSRGDGRAIFGWRRRYWSFLLKLAKNRPSWTVAASPGPAQGPFHWANRRLAQDELAALQTIPLRTELDVTMRDAQRLIGNAVPSALGEALGRAIYSQWFGKSVETSAQLVPSRRGNPPRPSRVKQLGEHWIGRGGVLEDHPGPGAGPGAKKARRGSARN